MVLKCFPENPSGSQRWEEREQALASIRQLGTGCFRFHRDRRRLPWQASRDGPAAARNEAISYAAYRILKERYALSRSSAKTLAALDARMIALGYDPSIITQDLTTPAASADRSVRSFWQAHQGTCALGDGESVRRMELTI